MTEGVRQRGLEQLGAHFEELSALLSERSGMPDPEGVVAFAARSTPHAEHCGLTLTRGSSRPMTLAATGALVEEVDRIQYKTGEGPCLEAVHGHDLTRAQDLATDQQWPRFGARCVAETGVRTMFSVRLCLSGEDRAALNFYAHQPGVLDDLDVGTGAILAPFAALAVQAALREREVGQLQTALQSSRQIGIAVGVLMGRRMVTADRAFDLLVAASQNLNRKLRDVAAEVGETGVLPARPTDGPSPQRRARAADGRPG